VTKASQGMEAAAAARKMLISRHAEEYSEILRTARVARGLSPEPGKPALDANKLEEQERKLEARLDKVRTQLNELRR